MGYEAETITPKIAFRHLIWKLLVPLCYACRGVVSSLSSHYDHCLPIRCSLYVDKLKKDLRSPSFRSHSWARTHGLLRRMWTACSHLPL